MEFLVEGCMVEDYESSWPKAWLTAVYSLCLPVKALVGRVRGRAHQDPNNVWMTDQ